MILREIKYDFMRYAKKCFFSENYSVFCTGRTAFICDRKFNLIHKAEKLSYVHHAAFSPDEKNLLLISTLNLFYILNLQDFSMTKHVIRGKYNYDLDGRGCWSLDGKLIYLLVSNPKTLNSALRCYNPDDGFSYVDFYAEKYWLQQIVPVKELGKYLLIGLDRNKAGANREDCQNLLWFDGNNLEEHPIEEMYLDVIHSAEYDAKTNTVMVYGHDRTIRCDIHGKCLDDIPVPEEGKITASFSDVFKDLELSGEDFESVKSLSASLGMENISISDSIYKMCLSSDGGKVYIATHLGLFVVNAATHEIMAKKKVDYGVQDIMEISPNKIAIATWNGVKVFEVI